MSNDAGMTLEQYMNSLEKPMSEQVGLELEVENTKYYALYEYDGTTYVVGPFTSRIEANMWIKGFLIGADGSDYTAIGIVTGLEVAPGANVEFVEVK